MFCVLDMLERYLLPGLGMAVCFLHLALEHTAVKEEVCLDCSPCNPGPDKKQTIGEVSGRKKMKTSKRLLFKKKKKKCKKTTAFWIASYFYLFFALLVHLERFSCQLKRTISNISQAAPLHIFYQGNMFLLLFFSFFVFFLEATSKPFDTAEKLTVTVQGLYWCLKKGCNS